MDDDGDGDDAPYALTPAVRRRDTITRQLQREILGETAALSAQQEDEDETEDEEEAAHTTPEASSAQKEARSPSQETKTEDDEPPSSEERRRRTLSPAKVSLLEEADAAVSRRDTVSPGALKAVLQASQQEEQGVEQAKDQQGSPRARRKTLGQQLQDSPARSTRSQSTSASKRPRSAAKTDERRKSASMGTSSDSFTDSMFAPNLLEQDAVRRSTLDPTEAASVVAALQQEARTLSSSTLEMDVEWYSDNQASTLDRQVSSKSPTPAAQPKSKKTPLPAKEAKRRKSPTPSKEAKSTKSPSPAKATKSRQSPSPAKESGSRRSPPPAKPAKSTKAPTPTKGNSTRRTTVDPSDALLVVEDNAQQREAGRRETIDESGLLELASALESPSAGAKGSPRKHSEEASRKRANDSDARGGSPEKRARPNGGNDADEPMESMEMDSPVQAEAKAISPLPSSSGQKSTAATKQQSPGELPPSRIPKPSLFSPPPGGTRIRTPLKGILSARKARQDAAEGAVQTTPSKSVNFGPSQGAEFNHGSPSTSMTPMLAKVASRLFPLEPPVSSEEEPDDAETSLNSSILDEADSLDEEEPKRVSPRKLTQHKKSGFDLLQSRRSSLLVPKTTDKSRRRQSLRGYSPLDAQTEARTRRRQTISVPRHTSAKPAAASAAMKQPASSQSPASARNNSFLSVGYVLETSRMPYADSSASSDAGEDMEITGDYSIVLGHEVESLGRQSIAPPASVPRDEDTAEFSLGHLLAESSVYELTKSAPEPDLHDLPGSLGDLANEVADAPSTQRSQTADASRRLDDQDTTLDPIQEGDETMASSRGQSMMSLDSGDESDTEYAARRESLKVNLTSSFDRVSAGNEAPDGSQPPEAPPVQLITMEELLASVTLSERSAVVEADEEFFGQDAEPSANRASTDVKLACAYDTCSEVVQRHAQDIASWSAALTEELSGLLRVKAPALFSPENLDEAGREAIQELYATEATVARSGWCQLQAQIEKELTGGLSQGASALANDVKTLQTRVSTDALKRQNELAAIREMIDREEQMGLLLDAIEEQQGAHDEYVAAVKELENECSSLSLEESVLQSRLKVLEGRAAELEPVTSVAATLFEQEVLVAEEMLAIQESMSVWKVREATASLLRLSARFEDVMFAVEICVDVHLGSSSTGGASTSIKTHESLKRSQRNVYLPYEDDAVLVLQRLLLNPHYITRIADESEPRGGDDGRVSSKLQVLEHFITRSFRLLRELRELSTHFALRFSDEDSTLWVDFLKFPSTAAQADVAGAQFSVGFSLLPEFPYTDYQADVRVPHGKVRPR
jgi:hypothetical protein